MSVATRLYTAHGDAGDELAAWAADELSALGWEADGLYVATAVAGQCESVEFWRAANETGLAFANPRLFPWTLANSATGSIARALGIRGPTYTLVGHVEAIEGALEHADDDITDGVVRTALLVAIGIDSSGRPRLAAMLSDSPTPPDPDVVGTFGECLTSSASRAPVTSPRSR